MESLFGTLDENLKLLESALKVTTYLEDNDWPSRASLRRWTVRCASWDNTTTWCGRASGWTTARCGICIKVATSDPGPICGHSRSRRAGQAERQLGKKPVTPRSANQRQYMEEIERNDMVFVSGRAGPENDLAVAMAVSALLAKQVHRIILARPAVEAGERLGFLPGTVRRKIDPYLRPLYDAMYDAGARTAGKIPGKGSNRDRAAGVHAQQDVERLLHHSGSNPEHHRRERRCS